MDFKVKGCSTCPLNDTEYDACNLGRFTGVYITTPYIKVAEQCPLLKEPITFSLIENTSTREV